MVGIDIFYIGTSISYLSFFNLNVNSIKIFAYTPFIELLFPQG